jgi:hypothetical protein
MFENSNSILNFYSVKQFQTIFRIYTKILTPFLIFTFVLGYMNIILFESRILEPYLNFLFIAIISSALIIVPYFLYILFIEKKKKWILSFFIFVVIPFIIAYMIFQQFFFSMMGAYFPALFYGVYCLLLKSAIDKWVSQYYRLQAKQEAEAEKAKENIKINLPF